MLLHKHYNCKAFHHYGLPCDVVPSAVRKNVHHFDEVSTITLSVSFHVGVITSSSYIPLRKCLGKSLIAHFSQAFHLAYTMPHAKIETRVSVLEMVDIVKDLLSKNNAKLEPQTNTRYLSWETTPINNNRVQL